MSLCRWWMRSSVSVSVVDEIERLSVVDEIQCLSVVDEIECLCVSGG